MHKKMPATTWLAWVHVFNYFTCLLDRGASKFPSQEVMLNLLKKLILNICLKKVINI